LRLRTAILVLALSAASATAQTAEPPKPSDLRGAPMPAATGAVPTRTPAPPQPVRPTLRPVDPDLISPSLQAPVAPRIEGLIAEPERNGGADCRTTCATDLYHCQGGPDAGDQCQQTWSACVLACPTNSSPL
jgi:hypothetical protein